MRPLERLVKVTSIVVMAVIDWSLGSVTVHILSSKVVVIFMMSDEVVTGEKAFKRTKVAEERYFLDLR